MQNEPELDARVGYRDTDAVRRGLLERAFEVRMFITVEDAPDLVVRSALAPSLCPRFAALRIGRTIHQLERSPVEVVDSHSDGVTELTPPVHEVAVLGSLAFREHQELASCHRSSGAAGRAARLAWCQCSPAVIISAAAANC